jgi:hypothetical protein
MATGIDALTLRPLYLDVCFGDEVLSIATGFPWTHDGMTFLLTCHHVVSGMHPDTGQPILHEGTIPDYLRLHLHSRERLGKWEAIRVELHDNQGRPLWQEHPRHQSHVDVAALPITVPDHLRAFPLNELPFDEIRIEVSNDVFILGYPRGIAAAGRFPIWKRGSIASEPQLNPDGLPKILVDAATREGMSGSPVIAEFTGFHQDKPGEVSAEDWIGTGRSFLGLYSGRFRGDPEYEAQIGIVWKASAVNEVVTGGLRPR